MKSSRIGARVRAILALCTSLGMATTASAATQWCFDVPTIGQKICVPFLTEEIPIKLPPNPGPYRSVDIDAFSEDLMRTLGTNQSKWILSDASGERLVLMDFETQNGFEFDQPVGP